MLSLRNYFERFLVSVNKERLWAVIAQLNNSVNYRRNSVFFSAMVKRGRGKFVSGEIC